jgi:TetR/AcrR family transcriptional regulator
MAQTSERKRTGRPRAQDAPVTLERILDEAFRAFATYGYDGVTVRTLNRELGVSHNLIHQRFGSKQGLWYAAVDRAFSQQVTELATAFDPTLVDPLDQLNHAIRRFVSYSAERPELLGLMNIEARVDSERLDYIYDNYVAPDPPDQPTSALLPDRARRRRPVHARPARAPLRQGGPARSEAGCHPRRAHGGRDHRRIARYYLTVRVPVIPCCSWESNGQ